MRKYRAALEIPHAERTHAGSRSSSRVRSATGARYRSRYCPAGTRRARERDRANSEIDNRAEKRTIAEKERRCAIPVARALTRSPASANRYRGLARERQRGSKRESGNSERSRENEIHVYVWVARHVWAPFLARVTIEMIARSRIIHRTQVDKRADLQRRRRRRRHRG